MTPINIIPFWVYRSPSSPISTRIGVTDNERLLTRKEIAQVFGKFGISVEADIIWGINVNYLENKKAAPLLTIYNLFDHILAATPLAGIIGAWIIGFGTKK